MNTTGNLDGLELLTNARLAAMPLLRQAHDEITSWSGLTAAQALQRAESLVRALIGGGILTELVNFELAQISAHPQYMPPARLGIAGLLSIDGWELTVTCGAAFTSGGAPKLSSYERDVVYGVAAGPPVACSKYHFAGVDDWEVFDRSARLVPAAPFMLHPGDVVAMDSSSETFDANRPAATVTLTLASPLRRAFVWEFDRETFHASRFVIADLAATRIAYTPELLAQLQSVESVPILEELTTHPRHVVRWNAIKALCVLDPATGLRVLETARADAHPHVRRAAEASLLNFASQEVA